MPLSSHFGGHGKSVMKSMKETYGPRAEKVFYATDNARKNRHPKEDSRLKKSMKAVMNGGRGGSRPGRNRD